MKKWIAGIVMALGLAGGALASGASFPLDKAPNRTYCAVNSRGRCNAYVIPTPTVNKVLDDMLHVVEGPIHFRGPTRLW